MLPRTAEGADADALMRQASAAFNARLQALPPSSQQQLQQQLLVRSSELVSNEEAGRTAKASGDTGHYSTASLAHLLSPCRS